MALIHWSGELETGVASIDAQHRRLVELLNSVHSIMVEHRDARELEEVFSKLVEYTGFHFDHEEELFERHFYPFADRHKAEHLKLKASLTEYINAFKEGSIEMMDLLAFLVDWLQDHIQETDKAFGRFLAPKLSPGM
jgi:methyl-accepting chemotaxis protein/hemerythrin